MTESNLSSAIELQEVLRVELSGVSTPQQVLKRSLATGSPFSVMSHDRARWFQALKPPVVEINQNDLLASKKIGEGGTDYIYLIEAVQSGLVPKQLACAINRDFVAGIESASMASFYAKKNYAALLVGHSLCPEFVAEPVSLVKTTEGGSQVAVLMEYLEGACGLDDLIYYENNQPYLDSKPDGVNYLDRLLSGGLVVFDLTLQNIFAVPNRGWLEPRLADVHFFINNIEQDRTEISPDLVLSRTSQAIYDQERERRKIERKINQWLDMLD